MKTKKPKLGRPKLRSMKKLKEDLDKIFSLYIRARDGKCVQCGSTDQPTNGHLFTRGHFSTRWDELNCHQQCWGCNSFHKWDAHPYTSWFIRQYGIEAYDDLHVKHSTIRKFSRYDLEAMIAEYKAKVESFNS